MKPSLVHRKHSQLRRSRVTRATGPALGAIAFVALLGATTTACKSSGVSLAQGYRTYTAEDYSEVLKRWTRKTQTFSLQQTDELLTVQATYQSWDFRWAYAERYADDYQLGQAERETLRENLLRQSSGAHEFYLTVYGTSVRWTQLNKPTTAWIVRLVDDSGAITSPSDIEEIRKPGALERRYFPYTTPYRNVFRIRFPKVANDGKHPSVAPGAKWMGLRFSGPQGRAEMRWNLEPQAAGNAPAPATTSPPGSPAAAGK